MVPTAIANKCLIPLEFIAFNLFCKYNYYYALDTYITSFSKSLRAFEILSVHSTNGDNRVESVAAFCFSSLQLFDITSNTDMASLTLIDPASDR